MGCDAQKTSTESMAKGARRRCQLAARTSVAQLNSERCLTDVTCRQRVGLANGKPKKHPELLCRSRGVQLHSTPAGKIVSIPRVVRKVVSGGSSIEQRAFGDVLITTRATSAARSSYRWCAARGLARVSITAASTSRSTRVGSQTRSATSAAWRNIQAQQRASGGAARHASRCGAWKACVHRFDLGEHFTG
jgi:hypothetical protein